MFGKVVWGSGDRGHNRKLWSGRGLYLCPALSLSCPALKAIQIQIQIQMQKQIQTQIQIQKDWGQEGGVDLESCTESPV